MADIKAAAWNAFLAQLGGMGLDFPSVQFADAATRTELLGTMELSVRDRALVSSAWAQMANGSSASASPGSFAAAGSPVAAASPSPQRAPQRAPSAADNGSSVYSASGAFGAGASPSPIPNRNGSIDVTAMNLVVNFDVTALKAALDRGDSGTALPLASEMLQCDPNGLIMLLHEYLPHVSVDQLKGMLGIGTVLSSSPNMSVLRAGEQAEYSSTSTLNGAPIQPGNVLTAQSLASQFGPGFTATCNGAFLSFPYCVQKGDHITVRPVDDRL